MEKPIIKNGTKAWFSWMIFVSELFGLKMHFKTLFKPWHRDVLKKDDKSHILFERIIFNVITRVIGATFRILIIVPGLVLLILSLLLYPFFLIFNLPVNVSKLRRHPVIGAELAYGFAPFLKRHSRSLSNVPEAKLVGKEEALEHMKRVLAREYQNNILLVGEPGIGRTTLVEQLAKKVYWGDVPVPIRYRRVYELNLEGFGKTEIEEAMHEASNAGNIIIVIDNIHAYKTLPDTLLPYLEDSEMQIIGITDYNGFHNRLKERTDMMRLFEKIEVHEPSSEETISLIKSIIQKRHLEVSEKVLSEIVRLTNQLIHHVPQPEKSLDVVEELLVAKPDKISLSDVHTLLSEKTGVPVGELSVGERKKLLDLELLLKRHIIGQDKAISVIAEAIRRGRAGVASAERPIGSFLFLGPTGVGKTHTAKTLATVYYGNTGSMIRFDMSEYHEPGSSESFIERLVIAIEDNPFTLVLFDEIEKAHGDILNLLLQILDEAHITTRGGRSAYFNNAFIICTSNAGSKELTKNPTTDKKTLTSLLIEQNVFRSEFLNRFDDIILFAPLNMKQAHAIAGQMLKSFAENIKSIKQITLDFDDGVIEALAQEAYDSRFGARAIRRELNDTIGNYVAEQIIKQNLKSGQKILISPSLFKKSSK
jgi:ATP-dependent Clp protease ATP-binding subunit ClpA